MLVPQSRAVPTRGSFTYESLTFKKHSYNIAAQSDLFTHAPLLKYSITGEQP